MKFTKNYNFRSLSLENHLQTIYLLSFSLEIMQYIAFDQLIIRGSSALNCHGIVTPNTKSDCQWVEISLMVCVVIVCFQLFTNSRFFSIFVCLDARTKFNAIDNYVKHIKTRNICLSSAPWCWSFSCVDNSCYFNQLLPRSLSMFWICSRFSV